MRTLLNAWREDAVPSQKKIMGKKHITENKQRGVTVQRLVWSCLSREQARDKTRTWDRTSRQKTNKSMPNQED
jgi:hypothetical protein